MDLSRQSDERSLSHMACEMLGASWACVTIGIELTQGDVMRILVVEDDPDSRDLLVEVFRMHGWSVTAVANVESGLEHLRGDHFDLVITDENLDDGTGSTMLREAKEEGLLDDVGVILYTAQLGRIDVPSGVRVLRKPKGLAELFDEAKNDVVEPPSSRAS